LPIEGQAGNYDRAKKHLIIAARAGSEKSLDAVKEGFTKELMNMQTPCGHTTRDKKK